MRGKLDLILLGIISLTGFIVFLGFILSNIDPANKLEGYLVAISFIGIFTTFGGAYLGAKISGEYAIKVQSKERELIEREKNFVRNIYIINYIRFNSVMFSKVKGVYITLENLIDSEEKINELYKSKGGKILFTDDNEAIEIIDLYDFIFKIKEIVDNIINDEKCILADDRYTDALIRIKSASNNFLNTFKNKKIFDNDVDYLRYYLEQLIITCKGIIKEHDNFWDR
ncbi:hypothetical protein [Staphylococcus delphini]|uniref:hypothetical protein n=1 Tax=Staphylococcus delphini TaxID=53344 RepID=UPI000BBC4629|nr:hypothetical protein [Staphylococcus delphini]PCF37861.1 hypothetical protein B5B99_08020 [Staphylococcus delphini]PCF50853.1 hypothetical protein B5C03_10275 [Staphylococcus delphini]PCF56256.1 hypothetical protein B5B97_08520 [Staphylococcus delphini]PCF58748.1 hypothetical protein B5C05_09090 [Staphylococcus delphini]